mgnify:CR=1 FL=1
MFNFKIYRNTLSLETQCTDCALIISLIVATVLFVWYIFISIGRSKDRTDIRNLSIHDAITYPPLESPEMFILVVQTQNEILANATRKMYVKLFESDEFEENNNCEHCLELPKNDVFGSNTTRYFLIPISVVEKVDSCDVSIKFDGTDIDAVF